MFTGLIQGQGELVAVDRLTNQRRFTIRTLYPLSGLEIGESIAVNGVCLTAETIRQEGAHAVFTAYASAETIQRTTLGDLSAGDTANLVRALAWGVWLAGHFVSGHVEIVATAIFMEQRGASRLIRLSFPPALAPEVVEKGSVTLDGISLTINACTTESLDVNVIPETWRVTTVAGWKPGKKVNMETDVLGKYDHHNLKLRTAAPESPNGRGVSRDLLKENGFL